MTKEQTAFSLEQLARIADKPAAEVAATADYEQLIQQSVEFLESDEAFGGMEEDPYWPKWNSAWWRLLLLHEMGVGARIPEVAIEKMIHAMDAHYLHYFPFTEAELPDNVDAVRHVACHCALGTMYQVLAGRGIDVDSKLNWVRPWFIRYQLADGGLNCDEAAYTRKWKRSSVVSTLPAVEAVLNYTEHDFSKDELIFLDQGAQYLIKRKLFRRASDGQIIDQDWLKLCFPRFYFYDVLRGLKFLTQWSQKLKCELPLSAIFEAASLIDEKFPDGIITVERAAWAGANSRWFDRTTGNWIKGKAASHALLEHVSTVGVLTPQLTQSWTETKRILVQLIDANLIA
ncbi:MAG TPA: hypothetical protein V6C81_15870 [Planktothrix sp.]